MDQLELRSADIVAHDIGGEVAQLIAVNYPERVRKLVLIDAVCFNSWPIPEFLPLQEPGAEEARTLVVEKPDGTAENMTADLIIINTGLRPFMPPVEGLGAVRPLNNASIMELDEVPGHLLVLGGA